jgi:hypothetical protein
LFEQEWRTADGQLAQFIEECNRNSTQASSFYLKMQKSIRVMPDFTTQTGKVVRCLSQAPTESTLTFIIASISVIAAILIIFIIAVVWWWWRKRPDESKAVLKTQFTKQELDTSTMFQIRNAPTTSVRKASIAHKSMWKIM